MSDIFDKVLSDRDPIETILSYVPGFKGYFDRDNRRSADKLLRETLANRFEELYQRLSALQRDMVSQGNLKLVGDLEAATIKIRTLTDRIRNATYGYSGLFDAVTVNSEELQQIYNYDVALLQYTDTIGDAIDNVERSIGSDGLPAAVRHLVSLSRESVETYDRRKEVILGTSPTE
ncbi:MAG: hypothetical protein ACK2UW_00690 [Anaerolineales bacterium]|jgi:hypothetical protein